MMPLTPFQAEVIAVIAANRRPSSHLAGGIVLNRDDRSPRFSDDLDIFHDPEESVTRSAEADAASLLAEGYEVRWEMREQTFRRAVIAKGGGGTRLDWAVDSAFRFFPVQQDRLFGYCLHKVDLATNKALALAGRVEARDYLDILHIDVDYLELGALVWAACGKDDGYTPYTMLGHMGRHTRFHQEDFADEHLTTPVDIQMLKQHWQRAVERAERLFDVLPAEEIGCLYLDANDRPVTPDPDSDGFRHLKRHKGSVRGAWPSISE